MDQILPKEDKLNLYLEENNALERVTELVHNRLVECGWRDQVRLEVRKALTNSCDKPPSVDDLIEDITPLARNMVPDIVKRDLLNELQKILGKLNTSVQK